MQRPPGRVFFHRRKPARPAQRRVCRPKPHRKVLTLESGDLYQSLRRDTEAVGRAAVVQANGIYAGTFPCKCFFFKMQVFLFLRGGRIGGHRVVAKLSVRGSVFEGLRLRKCFSSENESLFFRAESNAFSKGSRGSAIYEQKLCYG